MTSTENTANDDKQNGGKLYISDDEWERMKTLITDQLDNVTANLDDLRRDGSLESIARHIQRGDSIPSSRMRAWYHAMLEVDCCNRPEVLQKMEYMYRTHSTSDASGEIRSFVLDTTVTSQLSGKHDWRRRNGRPLESPRSVVTRLEAKSEKLTMVERNELWLARRSIKTEEMKSRAAEESLNARAKSAPDISRSQRSFVRTTSASQVDSAKPSTAPRRRNTVVASAAATTGNSRRNTINTKTSSARRSSAAGTFINTSDRSLNNITNHVKRKAIVKKKKREPISDPFTQRIKSK